MIWGIRDRSCIRDCNCLEYRESEALSTSRRSRESPRRARGRSPTYRAALRTDRGAIGAAERPGGARARLALSVCQKTRLLAARKSSIFAGRQGAVVGRIGHRPPGSSELRGPGSHGRSRNRFLADFQRARSVAVATDTRTAVSERKRAIEDRSEIAPASGRGLWWVAAVPEHSPTATFRGDLQ